MIGSICPVVLGPTTLEVPKDPMNLSTFNILFFLIGGIVILGLQKFKSVMEKKEQKQIESKDNQ